jgi:hypothetical protein
MLSFVLPPKNLLRSRASSSYFLGNFRRLHLREVVATDGCCA